MLMSTSQRSRAKMLFQINPLLKLMACLSKTVVALLLHQLAAIALLVGSLILLALLSVRLSLKVLVYGAIALTIGVAISTYDTSGKNCRHLNGDGVDIGNQGLRFRSHVTIHLFCDTAIGRSLVTGFTPIPPRHLLPRLPQVSRPACEVQSTCTAF